MSFVYTPITWMFVHEGMQLGGGLIHSPCPVQRTLSPGPGAGRGASRRPQAYSELVFLKFP